ncbi:MAG: ABC transporter permease [Halobacteria archaeon]|nr:ABC transporter permease [Candidatus Bathyarchaeota archaeon]
MNKDSFRSLLKWLKEQPSIEAKATMYLISVGFALLLFAITVLAMGYSPLLALETLIVSSLGGKTRLAETLVRMIPLIFTGTSVIIAFKANFWNLGVEGQLYWGAIALTYVGLFLANLTAPIQLLLAFSLAFLAGALWALIPGALKAYLGVNEIVTTIMMNYIVLLIVDWLATGPWHDPMGFEPITYPISEYIRLPKIIMGTRFHTGLLIALACVVVTYIILERRTLGYEIKAVGDNVNAAKRSGINIVKVIILTAFLSGGIAGLAGASEIAGVHYRLLRGISPGYGFTGIIIALIAKKSLVWSIPVAFFFAMLLLGSDAFQRTISMPAGAIYAIQAMIALCILMPEYALRRLKL